MQLRTYTRYAQNELRSRNFTQIKSYMFLKSGKVQRNTDNSANTTQT